MHDDSSSLTVFDEGSQQVVNVIVRQEVAAELPAVVWQKSLPTNEFFSILLDEANCKLGRMILQKIGNYRRFFGEDDVINESMRKLLRRLRRSIDGVAELATDHSTIYFNDFRRVWGYLRKSTERTIFEMKRKRLKDIRQAFEYNKTLWDVVAPVPSIVQEFKTLTEERWSEVIKNDVSIQRQKVLQLRLSGLSDREIASKLGTTHAKVRRSRIEIIDCFKHKFTSPIDLLEAMQS